MAVPVNAETGAGFIQPGDRVDLMECAPDAGRRVASGSSARRVVSNVRVLAVDQTTDPRENGKSIVGATVTLEVPRLDPVGRRGPCSAAAPWRCGPMPTWAAGRSGGQSGAGGEVRMFKGGSASEVAVLR